MNGQEGARTAIESRQEVKPEAGTEREVTVDFVHACPSSFGFPRFCSRSFFWGECLRVTNVEAHAAHCCRMATIDSSTYNNNNFRKKKRGMYRLKSDRR